MSPGDLLVVDASRKGTQSDIWLVLDESGFYTVAREGELLLHTGTRPDDSDFTWVCRSAGSRLWCFILRGQPCHLSDRELDHVRRSLRTLSRSEAA